MGRLTSELLEGLAPDGVETARHNHDDCPAGTDTKRRLYVTRKDDGVIVGYCHNCGSGGVAVHGRSTYRRKPSTVVVERRVVEITMPANLEFNPTLWPFEAQSWIGNAGLPLTAAIEYALAWDLDARRVIIPKFGVDNELVMWQSRNVGLDDGPKYITERLDNADIYTPIARGKNDNDTVVLVEDMLSAIKIDALAGYDTIPLFSSNVKLTKLLTAVDKYDIIIVWLDNDGVLVNRHRDYLTQQLRSIGKRVEVVTHLSDPKHHEVSVIIDTIEDVVVKF